MNPLIAFAVIVVLVAATTVLGVSWRARTGRVRRTSGDGLRPADLETDAQLGAVATIVQFSTEFCGPCRIAERVLDEVAAQRSGVTYIDVDLTSRPHVAKRFAVLQTPTVLLVDAAGGIHSRIGGVPRRADVERAIDDLVKEHHAALE